LLKELQVDPTVRFYTVEEVKAMDINSLVAKVEEKLGRKLDRGTLTWLAVAKGAGSVHTIDLSKGESHDEAINWEEITNLVNSPPKPSLPPYNGPKLVIEDPNHFVETLLFALEHSPRDCIQDPNTGKYVQKPGPVDSLIQGFGDLYGMAVNYSKNGWHFHISPDFVKHSFVFVCHDATEAFVFNGGLILSTPWNSDGDRYEDNEHMYWGFTRETNSRNAQVAVRF
jgi:hypothetical protein